MTIDEWGFIERAAVWVAATEIGTINMGLSREKAFCRAKELLKAPPTEKIKLAEDELDDAAIDVLHGVCQVLAGQVWERPMEALSHARALYDCISEAKWHEPDFEEKAELLCDVTFAAWRAARRAGNSSVARDWLQRFRDITRTLDVTPTRNLDLKEAENLLAVYARLYEKLYSSPSTSRDEAEFLYHFLQDPTRQVGLFDERDYFAGEFALVAGTACRQLSRRDEARAWFDHADLAFRKTVSAVTDLSRLAYQQLALRVEERQLDVVLEMSPSLRYSFEEFNMLEEALKCRFLEGIALVETGRVDEAIEVMEAITMKAEQIGSERLLSLAYTNLTHYHGIRGDSREALEWSKKAVSLLRRLDDRVGLAKVQWGLGNLLRETGEVRAAIDAYRAARTEFESLRMQADVADLSLVVADLLLELGHDREATQEILATLPVIDELKLVPEGMAALSLLRESVRQQRINRQALREVHGYFEENKQ